MRISNLQQLLEHEIKDLHSAERQIIDALPSMISSATHEELIAALEDHLDVSRKQLQRLQTVASDLDITVSASDTCEGIKGIIKEGEKMLKEIDDSATKDAAIIAAAQRVEHYEIAGYGSAAEYARQLGFNDAADELETTLEEEKEADESLSSLATGGWFTAGINENAIED